jgi:hypothetical protein
VRCARGCTSGGSGGGTKRLRGRGLKIRKSPGLKQCLRSECSVLVPKCEDSVSSGFGFLGHEFQVTSTV